MRSHRCRIRAVKLLVIVFALALCVPRTLAAQSRPATDIRVQSSLVLVPVLVTTDTGKIVFSLSTNDFVVKDDGIPQSIRLETDTDSEPLALAIIVQTGGRGAAHLADYRQLDSVLDAFVGGVAHRVAVISFGSTPRLERDFTSNTDEAAHTIAGLEASDGGASILDALIFGIRVLRKQPAEYRRAILLFSETIDSGSQITLQEAVRATNDTNTLIYSFAYSSTKAGVTHEAAKLSSEDPYPAGGCLSHDPSADPDAHGDRGAQAVDCISDLLPPLRLARIALFAARSQLKRNVPQAVAQLSGGEYYNFKNAATLKRRLIIVSNHVPNAYVLSFRPQEPHEGLHDLDVSVKNRKGLHLTARKAYWVDGGLAEESK